MAKLPPGKKRVFTALAVIMVLTLPLLIGETVVRLLDLRPPRYELPRYLGYTGSDWIEHGTWARGHIKRPSPFPEVEMGEYVPGARFRIVYASNPRGYFDEDGGVPASINSLGLRGEEVPARKRPGTYRILGIGDSFTFGVGVRDGDTFLRGLQERLNGGEGGKRRYEVLNAGVGGYNTGDEVRYLEHRWLALEPDLVLIGFYLNDAYSERTFLVPEEMSDRRPKGLARVSRLWDLLQFRRQSRKAREGIEDFYRGSYFGGARKFLENPGEAGKVVDWQTSRAALERAVSLTGERGIKIALVIFPTLYGLDGDYPFEDIHQVVGEACRDMSLPYLDLLEVFRGRKAEELWVHPTDHHPNEIAQRLIDGEIARFLTDPGKGLLKESE